MWEWFKRLTGAPAKPTVVAGVNPRLSPEARLERDIRRFTLALEQCDRKAKPRKYEELKANLQYCLGLKELSGKRGAN